MTHARQGGRETDWLVRWVPRAKIEADTHSTKHESPLIMKNILVFLFCLVSPTLLYWVRTYLTGNPKAHIDMLRRISRAEGAASLQNILHLGKFGEMYDRCMFNIR